MSRRKLFVSFTGLMYGIVAGEVSQTDLETGLFHFGCTREHAINPGAAGEHVETVVRKHPDVHAMVVGAILLAEGEGRIAWRTREDGSGRYELLLPLLAANGYAIGGAESLIGDWRSSRQYQMGHYSYPAVRDLVEDLALDIEVVF